MNENFQLSLDTIQQMPAKGILSWLVGGLCLLIGVVTEAADGTTAVKSILEMKGLVSFWGFQEESGSSRKAEENFNPFPYKEGIFDGGTKGAEFTVGANHVGGVQNNNRFSGLMSGLAVFDRALSVDEMAKLAEMTLPERIVKY